jgi:hypothetical protein
MACLDGQIDFVRDLLGNDDVDPAWECLNTAVGSGHRDVVQALLDDGRIDPRWGNGEAAVTAIVRNHERVLRTLLDDGRIATPAILGRMLMLVCRLGGTKLLQQLLRVAETDTNAAPPSSLSPLETAILRRHYGIVRELLDDRRTQIPPGIEGLMNHARNMGAENMYRTLQRNERVAKFLEERKGAQEQS